MTAEPRDEGAPDADPNETSPCAREKAPTSARLVALALACGALTLGANVVVVVLLCTSDRIDLLNWTLLTLALGLAALFTITGFVLLGVHKRRLRRASGDVAGPSVGPWKWIHFFLVAPNVPAWLMVGVVLFALQLLSEDRDQEEWDRRLENEVRWVAAGVQESLRRNSGLFEPVHVKAFFGDPDRTLLVRDLAVPSDEDATSRIREFPVEQAYAVYGNALKAQGLPAPAGGWRESPGFLDCWILLYKWDSPEPVMGQRQSYFFLGRDERVLGGGVIIRED